MIKKQELYIISVAAALGFIGAIFVFMNMLSAYGTDVAASRDLSSKTIQSLTSFATDSTGGSGGGGGIAIPTNTTYVPFNIGIGNTAPASDIIIASDLSSELVARNLISPTQTGLAKLFSEINAFQLDNKVTLLIYKGEAIIIVGQSSPSSHLLFASTLSSILLSKGITTKTILNNEVTSSNLESLFQTQPSCADSDSGLNYAIKGTITGGGVSFSQADYCLLLIPNGQADTVSCDGTNSNCRLHEFYCQDGVRKGERIQCPNGCSNGACLSAPKQTCTDSDGGYDRFKYGEVLVTGGPSNLVPSGKDRCYILNSGPATSCSGNLCTLEEYSCRDYDGDGVTESYGSGVENAPCPNGCSNGACISLPTTGSCRTIFNHLEMTMANPMPTIAQLKLPEDMNYTYNNYLYGNWTISVKIDTDQPKIVAIVTRDATQTTILGTIGKGKSRTISGLTVIFDSIDYTTGIPKAMLYITATDGFNGNDLKTESKDAYCYNNNLYQKSCPSIVTESSNFVETLIKSCTNGCSNSTCIQSANISNITCYKDNDCGTNTTTRSCMNNNTACTSSTIYQCMNPGTIESSCTGRGGSGCVQCPNGCYNGACMESPITTGSCRTIFNHLEMTMANPMPTIAQLKLPEDMNYTYNNYLYGNWTISVKIDTDQPKIVAIVTRDATQTTTMATIAKGKSKTISGLTIIFDSINNTTGIPKAMLYITATDGFNGNDLKTESKDAYCYNNNLYQKKCPSTVTENSDFVETLIQNCAYGCMNNSCLTTQLNYYCNDSDYNNQYRTGYVSGFNSKGEFKYQDSCNGNILTEHICQNGEYASIQHICGECENGKCIPSYCNNTLFLEKGNRYTINGVSGSINLSLEDQIPELNQIKMGVETEEGWQYVGVSEGDILTIYGGKIYIKDTFIDTIGGSTAAVFCYETKQPGVPMNYSCPVFTPPSPDWCADGTIIQGIRDVNDCVSPPACIPSKNQKCIDSDGGMNYNTKGTITYMNSEYTDSCKIYSENSLSVNDALLSEYYCDSTQGEIIVQYEEHVCPNGCVNGACIDTISYDHGDYPSPFISSDKNLDTIFIVGRKAKVDDVMGITDIVASLQRYAGNTVFPTGIVKFDDEVSEWEIENNNLILVGGMCANSVLADIYGYPLKCSGRDKKGVGKIEIIPNKNQNKYIISVHGFESEDTAIATRVLANWENYRDIFKDAKSLCVTGTVDNLIVQKC